MRFPSLTILDPVDKIAIANGGHVLSLEAGSVIEYDTAEASNLIVIADSVILLERLITSAAVKADLPEGTIITRNPSVVPRFNRRGTAQRLGYHINLADPGFSTRALSQVKTGLVACRPLVQAGGFGPSPACAFIPSPVGSLVQRAYYDLPHLVIQKRSLVASLPLQTESRLHIACFDSPFQIRNGLCRTIVLSQVVAGMVQSGTCPTGGLVLKSPESAYARLSVDPTASVRTSSGHLVDQHTLLEAFGSQLSLIRSRHIFPDCYEPVLNDIELTIDLLLSQDASRLPQQTQYHYKRDKIFRTLVETWGISWQRFQTMYMAVFRACRILRMEPFELAELNGREVRLLVMGAGRHRPGGYALLEDYMTANNIDYSELPTHAELVNRFVAIECRLGSIDPQTRLLGAADYAEYQSYRSEFGSGDGQAGRARLRSHAIKAIKNSNLSDRFKCDWANIYYEEEDDLMEIMSMKSIEHGAPEILGIRLIELEKDDYDEHYGPMNFRNKIEHLTQCIPNQTYRADESTMERRAPGISSEGCRQSRLFKPPTGCCP